MKIVIFNTLIQATEYFDRDYTEMFSRIETLENKTATIAHFTPKPNADGKYYYPALDGADYTDIETGDMQVSQPVQEPNEPTTTEAQSETVIEPIIEAITP